MKYPLPEMMLNKEERKHNIPPIVKFGLANDGISSTFHKVVIYGPLSIEVIGIFDPFVIQGAVKIAFIVHIPPLFMPTYPLHNLKQDEGGVY